MAGFGRSNSLNINTGTSLFGSSTGTSQPQQTGGLFGSTTTTSQPQQTSGLFGNLGTSQSQQSGGLFGLTTTSQPQQSGGLFGSLGNPAPSQPQQTTNLFGSLGTSQPQQNAGLFGSTAQSEPPRPGGLFGGSLFGGTSAAAQSQPQQTTSLFGGAPAGQTQQSGGGLFGNLGQQSKPAATTSLFGSSFQPQQTSLFSNPPPQPSTSIFGTGLQLGQSISQPAGSTSSQTVPGVKIDLSNIRGTTRFNDLHEDLQKQIEEFDTFIQSQIQYKETVSAMLPGVAEKIAYIPGDVQYLEGKIDTVELALDNDSAAIARLKQLIHHDAADARLSFRALETLKLPPQFQYYGGMGAAAAWPGGPTGMTTANGTANAAAAAGSNGDAGAAGAGGGDDADAPGSLIAYFTRKADELAGRLRGYQAQLAEIEAHMRTVEASAVAETEAVMVRRGRSGAGGLDGDGAEGTRASALRELALTMKGFEEAVFRVAELVGAAREGVVEVTVGGTGGVGSVRGVNGSGRVGGGGGRTNGGRRW